MKSKEAGKKFVCKHITIRPDQNEKIKDWPHGLLSQLTQEALDLIFDGCDEGIMKDSSNVKKLKISSYLERRQK